MKIPDGYYLIGDDEVIKNVDICTSSGVGSWGNCYQSVGKTIKQYKKAESIINFYVARKGKSPDREWLNP